MFEITEGRNKTTGEEFQDGLINSEKSDQRSLSVKKKHKQGRKSSCIIWLSWEKKLYSDYKVNTSFKQNQVDTVDTGCNR